MKMSGGLLSAVCLVFILSGVSHAARYSFTTLNYPGAVDSHANGIDGSNIVGYYITSDSKSHGFLYDGVDTWTPLNYPDAYLTYANGIDGSNIVGVYYDLASGHNHGFLYDGVDTWTQLDYPGATDTYAHGIDGSNIVGSYTDASGDHGFLYDGTTWTQLDFPSAYSTYAYGISGSNIVGDYSDDDGWHGFLYDGTTWTQLDYPGATETHALGIDGSNIVGGYSDATGAFGFLYDGSTWTKLARTGASSLDANGISGSNIVGTYVAAGRWHGFLAEPAPELEVSPSSYDFGSVSIDSCSAWQEFTLSNPGTLELSVSDITLSDTTNYELNLGGGSTPCGVVDPTITSGNSCTITVRFCPTYNGEFNEYLSVASNDPTSPTDVELTGTGKCSYSIDPSGVSVKWMGSHHVAIDVAATGGYCSAPDVVTNDDWITISRVRWRNNRGVVVFVVEKNTFTSPRTGGAQIEGHDVTINQDGARK